MGEFSNLVSVLVSEWIEEVRGSYQGDEYAKKVQEKFDDGSKEKEGWTVENGFLKKNGRGSKGDVREKIVKEIQGSALGGHSGILASYQRLKRKVIGQS